MNYVYGSNRLAIKSIFKDKDIDKELLKFKGSFEPHLYIPKKWSISDNMEEDKKFNAINVHNFAMNMVIACNITYRNLLIFGHYRLDFINPYKVKDDINTALFNHIYAKYGNGTSDPNLIKIKEICDKWNKNFLYYYYTAVNLLNKNMEDNIPNEIIRNRFPQGYFYKVRKKRQEREKTLRTGLPSKRTDWSWLNDKSSEEIAREIIRRGIHHNRTLEKALQKRNISITAIKESIKYINDNDKDFVTTCLIDHWFNARKDKEMILSYYRNYINGCMDKDILIITLINLGYQRAWIDQFNDLYITTSIRMALANNK